MTRVPMMKWVEPTEQQKRFRNDVIEVLRGYGDVPEEQLLALASYLVGQLIALMDQTKYTPAACLEIVSQNLEAGNAHAIKEHLGRTLGRG